MDSYFFFIACNDVKECSHAAVLPLVCAMSIDFSIDGGFDSTAAVGPVVIYRLAFFMHDRGWDFYE
jgi:uncharacterized membrane protein